MNDEQIQQLSQVIKSIAHPIRLNILYSLNKRELTVGELAANAKTSSANLSQHLSLLRTHGLINTRREANYLYNSIADHRVTELIKVLHDLYCDAQPVQKSTTFRQQNECLSQHS